MIDKAVKTAKRSVALLLVFVLVGITVCAELFKLQILGYDDYQNSVIEQLTVETNVNPERGIIYDTNGKVLATNQTVWTLYIMPKSIKDPEMVSEKLSAILEIDYNAILEKCKKTGYKYQIIHNSLNQEMATKVRRLIDENGLAEQIQLYASAKRYYPYDDLAAHALGFVNADGVGIYGLEKMYNNLLEGTNGKYITAQNAQSGDMPFQYEEFIDDENGYNLVTTIDLYIQYQLENQLRSASIESGAQNRAAGIVMDPQTGEVLAMAVYPSFDLNEPYKLDELSQAKLDKLTKGTSEYKNEYLNLLFSMWNNKAVTELYEPGSTFKLVTTSVALQEKTSSLNNRFTCTGSLKIDGFYRAISCHKRTGHGTLTFAQALQQSCNPSMMKLAFGIGREKFYDYFVKFGYTGKTGIDLPSESVGYYHKFNDFSNVSLAVYSFGQTFKTTAIQQLRAVSAVANGGYLVTPHLIKGIVDNAGNTVYEYEKSAGQSVISEDVSKTISQILKEGVDGEGGAKNAYVAGYSVAAKTGTSEKKDKYDENGNTSYRVSSCVAYAPSDNPQVAVIILVDEPTLGSKYGSVVAAPYVSKLLEQILGYMGIEPEYSDDDSEHIEIKIPDLVGISIDEAIKITKEENLNYEIVGSGDTVVSQTPSPQSNVYKGTGKIILYTEKDISKSVIMPNVVGLTPQEANTVLINAGLNIKIEGASNFKYGQGAVVISQGYEEGISLKKGTVVPIKILFTDEEE